MTRRQLVQAGVPIHRISTMVEQRTLRRVQPGVFLVGEPPEDPEATWLQRCAIALAACGEVAAVCGPAAATLRRWDGFEDLYPPTVDIPLKQRRVHPAARRRVSLGPPEDRRGLAVCAAEHTLLALGDELRPRRVMTSGGRRGQLLSVADQVELALETALRRGEVKEQRLLDLLAEAASAQRGRATLGEVVQRRPPGQRPTESYLETRCVQVLRNAGLPTGVRQVDIFDERQSFVGRVDFQLSDDVIVETDGYEHHRDERHEEDRRRWTRLNALGYRLGVFTWEQVEFQPNYVVRQVRDLLG